MTRARLVLAAGLALAGAAGCGSKATAPPSASFRLPSAIALFHGKTTADPNDLQPYLAVANEGRNDLTIVNATNNAVVLSPVLLRPLAVFFPDRPAHLASASLGDGGADLLVGVSAGTSVLQLVQTWVPANTVDADAKNGQAVELGADVLRIVALPGQPAGTARLAVALAGQKLAIVEYSRLGDAVVKGPGALVVHGLGFEAADLAVVPGDGGHVYAATLDAIGSPPVHGVAEIDVSTSSEPWPVRGLDARGPTRLVAAARLQERRNDLPVPGGDPGATDPNPGAFAGQPTVTRVYAVLDESGCGFQKRIDCGVVTLDPAKTPGPGDDHIPEDWAGWMPYRAPISFSGVRPLALAVALPPAVAPPDWDFGTAYMRLVLGAGTDNVGTVATTAVGAVAMESGFINFIDLGRFKTASTTFAPIQASASVVAPPAGNRIWIQDPVTGATASSTEASNDILLTPGYSLDEGWTLSFQSALPSLLNRAAEVGVFAGTTAADIQPWLAIQFGDGNPGDPGRPISQLSQVARLYHPALGVRVGDIVTFKVESLQTRGIQCDGLPPPGTSKDLASSVPHEFETQITQLLAPTQAYPGGAVVLKLRTKGDEELEKGDVKDPPEWAVCWSALLGALQASPSRSVKGLQVNVDAGGLLLRGTNVGYAGRPVLNTVPADPANPHVYVLRYKADPADPRDAGLPPFMYQDEDALAAQCPLADWDGTLFLGGTLPPALDCGGTGCDRDLCEQLVLARKVRRRHHLSEDCHGDATCLSKYPTATFPIVNGAALRVRVFHEALSTSTTQALFRDLTLTFSTSSGIVQLGVSTGGPTTQANGAVTFDRSPYPAPDGFNAGYRFYVSYPGNQIADVSPSLSPVASNPVH